MKNEESDYYKKSSRAGMLIEELYAKKMPIPHIKLAVHRAYGFPPKWTERHISLIEEAETV